MIAIIKDLKYLSYYVFTALMVATILLVEDLLEGEKDFTGLAIEFIGGLPLFILMTALISLLGYTVINLLNKHFPWQSALLKRFLIEITIVIALVVVLTLLASAMARNTPFSPEDADDDFDFEVLSLIMFFISTFMVFSFHEFMNLSNDKAYLEVKTAQLEKQNYLIKYEALKSQVNPHFLFNSLNVLSSLIYQDTDKADLFIKKFADVFRYVLELNHEKLVTVKQELKFLEAYFFLQKIRYGDHLILNQKIDAAVLNKAIPPLSLQLVMENTIKHNVITAQQNLCITITNTSDTLVVKNNYQYRGNLGGSLGVGQKNLTEKYRLITEKLPAFYIEDKHYIANLPLIDKTSWKGF